MPGQVAGTFLCLSQQLTKALHTVRHLNQQWTCFILMKEDPRHVNSHLKKDTEFADNLISKFKLKKKEKDFLIHLLSKTNG
jgi:hypothetical protein